MCCLATLSFHPHSYVSINIHSKTAYVHLNLFMKVLKGNQLYEKLGLGLHLGSLSSLFEL